MKVVVLFLIVATSFAHARDSVSDLERATRRYERSQEIQSLQNQKQRYYDALFNQVDSYMQRAGQPSVVSLRITKLKEYDQIGQAIALLADGKRCLINNRCEELAVTYSCVTGREVSFYGRDTAPCHPAH